MKRIKIILGVIIFSLTAFLSTGLFVKETTYTTQIQINKPLEEVFEVFNDSSQINNWITDLKSIDPIDLKPEKTGSTYKIVVENKNGEQIILQEKIMAYIPNEKLTLFFRAETMLKTDDYLFSFKNGITTVKNTSICRGNSYLLSCLFPYFKSVFKNQDQEYLNNFKSYIEKK